MSGGERALLVVLALAVFLPGIGSRDLWNPDEPRYAEVAREMLASGHPFAQVQLELQRHGTCREVPLSFLSRADITSYLALDFPGHRFPADLPARLHAQTAGNPRYLLELVGS